jgi:hypothetical protein
MATQLEVDNLVVLGNASHLIAEIISKVAGNDISNHHEGKPITNEVIVGIAQASLNKELGGN